jgi:drug/metabolite transporter (DMT)-like permease
LFEFAQTYTGHLAGLATSLLWTGTSIFFTSAGRRIGPVAVNVFRIMVAIVLLGLTHRLLEGTWIPRATSGQVLYLAASGVVGLSIGDQALFGALMAIGPRLATLVMTTAPLFAAFFGWWMLDERLSWLAGAGVMLTIGGVAWVVLGRQPVKSKLELEGNRTRGVLLALVAAACQGGGLLLSKKGMGHGWMPASEHIVPQTATLIRMTFAGAGVMPILWIHQWRERSARAAGMRPTPRPGRRGAGYAFAAAGAVFGPYLGVWMSLVASDRAPVGVAQTLCSLTPIFLAPVAAWVYRERISLRAVLGAFVAVGGASLLFF